MKLLGEILCKIAGLKEFQLEQALKAQQEQTEEKNPLGEILVENGYITEQQLQEALAIQKNIDETASLQP